ncbi:hypothetical protein EV193_1151 [Herbihabitans rhizosphaerae]|uniref:Uncharacterized protein n=1 Tax=Herbihabitans rhizosphaerae TaxID=1872711 RepID=A0A4V2ERF4_9PSEU|nr:hypothetical protein EV193_1151 [Herbihabitans rhizosphaerae]
MAGAAAAVVDTWAHVAYPPVGAPVCGVFVPPPPPPPANLSESSLIDMSEDSLIHSPPCPNEPVRRP